MTYAEKLKSPHWQKKRLKILERDKWACCFCGDTETNLHVHHKQYHKEPWDANDSMLQTLCEPCHKIAEDLKEYYNLEIVKVVKIENGESSLFIAAFLNNKTDRSRYAVGLYSYLLSTSELIFFTSIKGSSISILNSCMQNLRGFYNKTEAP